MTSDQLLAAFAQDLEPLRKRVAAILQISDPEILRARLTALLAELPQLNKDITADPAAAQVLAPAIADAMRAGLEGRQPT